VCIIKPVFLPFGRATGAAIFFKNLIRKLELLHSRELNNLKLKTIRVLLCPASLTRIFIWERDDRTGIVVQR
jgi:hypothetical protein